MVREILFSKLTLLLLRDSNTAPEKQMQESHGCFTDWTARTPSQPGVKGKSTTSYIGVTFLTIIWQATEVNEETNDNKKVQLKAGQKVLMDESIPVNNFMEGSLTELRRSAKLTRRRRQRLLG